MNILTVIPARGGSKGVPRKNIKMLGGKPLIAWTIEAAKRTNYITTVSTDDMQILRYAAVHNCRPLLRPPELAQDDTPMVPVVQHAVRDIDDLLRDTLEEDDPGNWTEWILLLQPTCPFRIADDIKAAIALAEQGDCDSVISVVKVGDHHPARMYTIDGDYMKALYPDEETKRRQDLSPLYLRNGAIYLTRRDVIMGGSVWGKRIKPLVMPPERSVNIDSMLDWKLAEAMLVRD